MAAGKLWTLFVITHLTVAEERLVMDVTGIKWQQPENLRTSVDIIICVWV